MKHTTRTTFIKGPNPVPRPLSDLSGGVVAVEAFTPRNEPYRDAGRISLQIAPKPVLKRLASAPATDLHPKLEGHPLRDVVNDTRSRAFCGPTAVAAITGEPVSLVRDAYRLVRHGPSWVDRPRAPAITSTYYHETEKVLRLLGFVGSWQPVAGSPTFAAFLEARSGVVRTHLCAVFVTRHVVAVSGWQFCDTLSKGVVVEADDAPGRRKRVKRVFVITGRVPPSTIPRKVYSKPSRRVTETQMVRDAYKRFLAELGARHKIDRSDPDYPTITVTFSDGKRIGMHFDNWLQALDDLEDCLEDPRSEDLKEIDDGHYWYDV